jgi:hypothetical protein
VTVAVAVAVLVATAVHLSQHVNESHGISQYTDVQYIQYFGYVRIYILIYLCPYPCPCRCCSMCRICETTLPLTCWLQVDRRLLDCTMHVCGKYKCPVLFHIHIQTHKRLIHCVCVCFCPSNSCSACVDSVMSCHVHMHMHIRYPIFICHMSMYVCMYVCILYMYVLHSVCNPNPVPVMVPVMVPSRRSPNHHITRRPRAVGVRFGCV